MTLSNQQSELCEANQVDYSDLKAVLINASLKRKPADSHTGQLLDVVGAILKQGGVHVDRIHMAAEDVPPGIYPDMTEHGYATDAWPELWKRVEAADILVLGTPIWLGEESSVCRVLSGSTRCQGC